ncbi:MAG: energy transducer TonB, partial [Gammaproteobacteria bacterium]
AKLLVKSTPMAKLPDSAAAVVRETIEPKPPADLQAATPPAVPTAAQLITRSFALASLHAEVQQKLEVKATRPRMKFVSASTQEYAYAAYMEAWRVKVERIGNLNYPDEARKRKLSGSLLLDVALMPDGSVLEIIVRRSSGHRVLDDAAVRIVELAGPYAQFPPEILRQVDILHITRTWKFLSSEEFLAQ